MAINKLEIDGRLTRDAESKYTSNGSRVIKFTLAQTERKKQGDVWVDDGASFYDVEYWAHDSDDINKFSKGQYLSLVGKIKQDKWDQLDGQKRSKIKIIMKEIISWEFANKSNIPLSNPTPSEHNAPFIDDCPF